MQTTIRLLPVAVAVTALAIVAIGPWSVVASEASAGQSSQGFWDPTDTPGNPCRFLETTHGGIEYICADWITDWGPLVTCCIEAGAVDHHDLGDCQTVVEMPTTDDRPGL